MLSKNSWLLILFIFIGISIGGFLGQLFVDSPYFGWLNFGQTFNFQPHFDIAVIKFNLDLVITLNIASVIGIIIAIITYKKIS